MLRIGRGTWKGRVLRPPLSIRPSSGRIRAAALDIAGIVEGSWVWDLCCGSGAFGIECLSAGAAGCTFVDQDRKAVRYVGETLDELGGLDRARLLCGDVTVIDLSKLDGPDLVFIDPPYSSTRTYDWAFTRDWSAVLEPGGIVMIETPSTLESGEGWSSRRHGATSLRWRWI